MATGRTEQDADTESQGTAPFLLDWLLWPERVVARKQHYALTPTGDADFGFTSDRFLGRLSVKYRDMKTDDIRAICENLNAHCRELQNANRSVLAWLYRQCLDEMKLAFHFFDRTPSIAYPAGAYMRWPKLADQIDPDGLVCLALAGRVHTDMQMIEAEVLAGGFPLSVRAADRDLDDISRRGLTDLHIHFTSLWPVALSWLRVFYFPTNKRDGLDLLKLKAVKGGAIGEAIMLCLENAVGAGHGGLDRIRQLRALRPESADFFQRGPGRAALPEPNTIAAILLPERVMLLRAWRALLQAQADVPWRAIEAELDEYLVAKSLFRSLHAQRLLDTNKGLISFDQVRKYNAHLGVFSGSEVRGATFSESRFRRNRSYLMRALQECQGLVGAEVRIAPPEVETANMASAYCRTMRATHRLAVDLLEKDGVSQSPKLKVALHFKRALAAKPAHRSRDEKAGRPSTTPLLRKLLEFDRETATFHYYRQLVLLAGTVGPNSRNRSTDVEASRRFSRVDLASPERGAGPWTIAPYVRLLRGDVESLQRLKSAGHSTYFPKWAALVRRQLSELPLGLPELRVTCHAGEDFYTLVDGLRHIDSAIVDWRMKQGDALGHCLALGLDAKQVVRTLSRVWVPLGVELDSLIWLRRLSMEHGILSEGVRLKLEDAVKALARTVYGPCGLHLFDVDPLYALDQKLGMSACALHVPQEFAINRLPLEPSRIHAPNIEPGEILKLLDYFDVGVAERRQKLAVPQTELHMVLCEIMTEVQKCLVHKIRRAGITIETNPSSNIRMERIPSPGRLPIIEVITKYDPSPRVTICTDNPGTYDTNVLAEYAIVQSALHEHFGVDAPSIVENRLERMRSDGQRLFSALN